MEWIAENWFLLLITILFIAMHMFGHGHGGHSGHGGHGKGHSQNSHEGHIHTEDDKNKHQHH